MNQNIAPALLDFVQKSQHQIENKEKKILTREKQ
jgi:hypothetical protein